MVIFASVAAFVVFVALVVLSMFLYRVLIQKNSSPTSRKREPDTIKNAPVSLGMLAGSFSKKYINTSENPKIDKISIGSTNEKPIPKTSKSVTFSNVIPKTMTNLPLSESTTLPSNAQKVIAIKNYLSRSTHELTLNVDDQIWLYGELNNEWGIGFNPVTGLKGAFPLNCCEQFTKLRTTPIFNQNFMDNLQNANIRTDSLAMLSTSSIYETESSCSVDNESIASKPRVNSMYSSRLNNLIYEKTDDIN
jgi:hypothetical protein